MEWWEAEGSRKNQRNECVKGENCRIILLVGTFHILEVQQARASVCMCVCVYVLAWDKPFSGRQNILRSACLLVWYFCPATGNGRNRISFFYYTFRSNFSLVFNTKLRFVFDGAKTLFFIYTYIYNSVSVCVFPTSLQRQYIIVMTEWGGRSIAMLVVLLWVEERGKFDFSFPITAWTVG